MADTFTAHAPGQKTTDPDGFETTGYGAVGTIRGKLAGRSRESDTNTRTVTVGGVDRPVVEGGLHIPVDADLPAAGQHGTGWVYELTTPGPVTDPALAGTWWLVVDVPAKSYATARRLDVVGVPDPTT